MRLVAMSSTIGGVSLVPGMATQSGFVDRRPSRPRNGVTLGGPELPLTKWIETSPAAAASGGLDRPAHGVAGDHLAVAVATVPDSEIAALADDLGHLIRDQGAGFEVPHVVRKHAHAVAVVAREVGVDEVVGDDLRLGRATAGFLEEGAGEAAQPLMIDSHAGECSRGSLGVKRRVEGAAPREGLGTARALGKATSAARITTPLVPAVPDAGHP